MIDDLCGFLANFSKKPFDIIDFGVCFLDDLIGELKDNKEVVVDQENGTIKLYRKGSSESFALLALVNRSIDL